MIDGDSDSDDVISISSLKLSNVICITIVVAHPLVGGFCVDRWTPKASTTIAETITAIRKHRIEFIVSDACGLTEINWTVFENVGNCEVCGVFAFCFLPCVWRKRS